MDDGREFFTEEVERSPPRFFIPPNFPPPQKNSAMNLHCDPFGLLESGDDDDSLAGLESWSQGDTAAGLIDEIGMFDSLSRANSLSSLSRTMSGGGSCKISATGVVDEVGSFELLSGSSSLCVNSHSRGTSSGFSTEGLFDTLKQSSALGGELESEQDKIAFLSELKFDLQAAVLARQTSWGRWSTGLSPSPSSPAASSSCVQQSVGKVEPVVLSVPRAEKYESSAPPLGLDEVVFVTCAAPDGSLLTRVWDGTTDEAAVVVVLPLVVAPALPAAPSKSSRRVAKMSAKGKAALGRTKGKGAAKGCAGDEVVVEDGDVWHAVQALLKTHFFVPQPPSGAEATVRRELCRHARSRARARLDAKKAQKLAAFSKKRHYPERQAMATKRKRVGGRFQKEEKGLFKSVTEIQGASHL
mmetsp:Transcript_38076/g.76923  ORF Transcript_38076/g.76923 Transcript_38076/m.76923 type:complete len:413 (-) Transcript_38076:645-1883(-)